MLERIERTNEELGKLLRTRMEKAAELLCDDLDRESRIAGTVAPLGDTIHVLHTKNYKPSEGCAVASSIH